MTTFDTYTQLEAFLGGARSAQRASFHQGRHATIERVNVRDANGASVDAIDVLYRTTRLVRAFPDALEITMQGWYTENSQALINETLPTDEAYVDFVPAVDDLGRTISHPMHSYAVVRTRDAYGREAMDPLLEGVEIGQSGVRLVRTNNAYNRNRLALPYPPRSLGAIAKFNNTMDDKIDALMQWLGPAMQPHAWGWLYEEFHAQAHQNFLMRPLDVIAMIDRILAEPEDARLDAPVFIAALRYDTPNWRGNGERILDYTDITELRNTLRVFLLWFCLTGPLALKRSPRPRPLTLHHREVFLA